MPMLHPSPQVKFTPVWENLTPRTHGRSKYLPECESPDVKQGDHSISVFLKATQQARGCLCVSFLDIRLHHCVSEGSLGLPEGGLCLSPSPSAQRLEAGGDSAEGSRIRLS